MPWPPAQPPRGPARWPVVVMFAITLVAVAAAVAAWLRPMPEAKSAAPSAPTFTAQQVADAKAKVCAAYQKVQNAVSINTTRTAGDDPNSQLLIAVNMRQVFVAGSAHLMTALADEPAAPADLAASAKKLAELYQVITLDGLVGDRNDPAHDDATQAGFTIQNLCK
jgi:hypothetical protein